MLRIEIGRHPRHRDLHRRYAFYGCEALEHAEISESATAIGHYAFYGCSSLTSADIPGTVIAIGHYAFSGCGSLSSVSIPGSVLSIGNEAFQGITFLDADGSTALAHTAEALRGYTYVGSNGTLARGGAPEAGDRFSSGGLTYEISALSPAKAALMGYRGSPTDVVVPDSVAYLGISFSVGGIGAGAFEGCQSLTSVSMESIETIGSKAFSGCPALSSVVFGPALKTVAGDAFEGFTFLDADGTVLEQTAESLRGYAYAGSDGRLARDGAPKVGDRFSSGGLVFEIDSIRPSTAFVAGYEGSPVSLEVPVRVDCGGLSFEVMGIGIKAFYGCKTLVSADLGGVSTIGSRAFAQCSRLATVDVGGDVKAIHSYAFYSCAKLASINLEDSGRTLKTIGKDAFAGCGSLARICMPSSLSEINASVFSLPFADSDGDPLSADAKTLRGYFYQKSGGKFVRVSNPGAGMRFSSGDLEYEVISSAPACAAVVGHADGVRSVAVPDSVPYGGQAYDVVAIGGGAFSGCVTLLHADLGSVDTVGAKAFYGCVKLRDVSMEDVKSIGMKAFTRCRALASVDLGDSLRTVGAYAFYACYSLEGFSAEGAKISSIGAYAFYACSGLADVDTCNATTIGKLAFATGDPMLGIAFGSDLASVGEDAFRDIVFRDGGTDLGHDADSLRGLSFSYEGGALAAVH